MDPSTFLSPERGQVRRTLEGYHAFFPNPLPRDLQPPSELLVLLEEATGAAHRLGGLSLLLPNPNLLMWPYLRVEAVLSSRIEGTQSTISDVLRYEAEDRAGLPADALEVVNYMNAMALGLRRLTEGFPLSLRLIREIHARLVEGVRGDHQTPGEFRRTQNWIGPPGRRLADATFVPPPVDAMHEALSDWERFLHEERIPLLLQLALAHYQFEVIHPFLDGNGRVGRLAIPLLLCHRAVLTTPLLYLSAYFERHRFEYYDHLLRVSQTGDLWAWVTFFLNGVIDQADDATSRTVTLVDMQTRLRQELLDAKCSNSAVRLAETLFDRPYLTVTDAKRRLGVTFPTAQKAIDVLCDRGVLREATGQPRNRVFVAQAIWDAVYGGFA